MDRRTFAASAALALSGCAARTPRGGPVTSARPRPSPAQLAWQREELALFLHFGINTFVGREWGDGREDPSLFNPERFDARQWAMVARAAGAGMMILTAKHHDGFCLWPTATTRHSVASSPWAGGAGDVVRLFVDAARAEGLRVGLYCSPWDRNAPVYGDSPRYNDLYVAQLAELLTRYGPIAEVWFDGANGEGPTGRRQEYDWPRTWALVRRLQPDAVIFSDAGPDVRWCGNERGLAGDPNWSTVDPAAVPAPGMWSEAIGAALLHGDPAGTVWRPAEADVSIRPGWFYHPAEDERVKSVDELTEIWFASVGRNAKLLLNIPPTPAGLIHEVDLRRLMDFRAHREELFRHDVAAGRRLRHRTAQGTLTVELDLGRETAIATVRLEEEIARGQAVARYAVHGETGGAWRELTRGTTIGHRKLDRFPAAAVRRVRVTVEEAVATLGSLRVGVYGNPAL
jgi:alpha-L-fucosidase